jgi:hypothetical protein
MFTYKTKNKNQAGYTLLFSVLISTVVLGVGVFILSVSKKQYELSVTARESIYAIYAADSGIECAIREFVWGDGVATSTTASNTVYKSAVIACNESSNVAVSKFTRITNSDQSIWDGYTEKSGDIRMHLQNDTCAVVTIEYGFDRGYNNQAVHILSRGYNQCVNGVPVISNRTIERALLYTSTN